MRTDKQAPIACGHGLGVRSRLGQWFQLKPDAPQPISLVVQSRIAVRPDVESENWSLYDKDGSPASRSTLDGRIRERF